MSENPLVGTWRLNVEKSSFEPGPAHAKQTIRRRFGQFSTTPIIFELCEKLWRKVDGVSLRLISYQMFWKNENDLSNPRNQSLNIRVIVIFRQPKNIFRSAISGFHQRDGRAVEQSVSVVRRLVRSIRKSNSDGSTLEYRTGLSPQCLD